MIRVSESKLLGTRYSVSVYCHSVGKMIGTYGDRAIAEEVERQAKHEIKRTGRLPDSQKLAGWRGLEAKPHDAEQPVEIRVVLSIDPESRSLLERLIGGNG